MSKNLKKIISAAIVLIIALIAGGVGISNINITSNENEFKAEIKFAEEQKTVEITSQEDIDQVESGQGEITVDGYPIPTVEAVESNGPVTETGE